MERDKIMEMIDKMNSISNKIDVLYQQCDNMTNILGYIKRNREDNSTKVNQLSKKITILTRLTISCTLGLIVVSCVAAYFMNCHFSR
jgi:uncharacterized coiled-coil DUF342 family protein